MTTADQIKAITGVNLTLAKTIFRHRGDVIKRRDFKTAALMSPEEEQALVAAFAFGIDG